MSFVVVTGLNKREAHSWKVADILHGPVNAHDSKTYISALLLLKQLCGAYDEGVDAARRESEGDMVFTMFPGQRRIQVPDDCHR